MPTVRERTGTFPDSDEHNGSTAPTADRGCVGYTEEMDMSTEAQGCFEHKHGACQDRQYNVSSLLVHA